MASRHAGAAIPRPSSPYSSRNSARRHGLRRCRASAGPGQLPLLATAVAGTLSGLPAEDRFLLSAYFLDRQTLLQIARTLGVHEATMSRRIKRLTANTRKQLLKNLVSAGLSVAAAEEALAPTTRH